MKKSEREELSLADLVHGMTFQRKAEGVLLDQRTLDVQHIPYFSHHDLELTIPGEDRVLHARKVLDKAANSNHAHRRWHMVLTYLRTRYARNPYEVEARHAVEETGQNGLVAPLRPARLKR